MTGTKLPIFMDLETLIELIVFEEDFPNLNSILKKHSIIYLDIKEEELDLHLKNSESELSNLSRCDVEIRPAKEFFKNYKDDEKLLLKKVNSFYLLDISVEMAEELSKKYGVIVKSCSEINDNIFQLWYKKYFEKGEILPGENNGWKNIFSNIKLPPANSIIITDRYLFGTKEKEIDLGYENLKLLLDALLPDSLNIPFHIYIIFRRQDKLRDERLNEIYEQLIKFLRAKRNYDIILELISYDTVHPRRIISNYYAIELDKGVQLFSASNNKQIISDNELGLSSILHDSIHRYGDSELERRNKILYRFGKFHEEIRLQILNGISEGNKKILGNPRNDKRIVNRLFG